jgi:SAM-dependent methyltransferase
MHLLQLKHQNPGCDEPLYVPVMVVPNTPEEVGNEQIRANGARDLPWLFSVPAHDGVAVICGGGPSLADTEDEIIRLARRGATLFGLNGSATWLADRGLCPEYQLIVDPQEITAALVEPRAPKRLFASQVHPDTGDHATMLFHLANIDIEDLLPPDRVAEGGYTLVGGGVSVGITALTTAYTLGFRRLHLFGYDSSNRGVETHAYSQPHNSMIPNISVEWAGKTYLASMPMKVQAEAFQRFAPALIEAGCEIEVYGSGLLPAMWHIEPMTEREKYQKLWAREDYRRWAPGEDTVGTFRRIVKPDGLVIDFGCGTGRAALEMDEAGLDVLCVDFTDNCRDKAAMRLRFFEWDLTKRLPVSAPYGYCTDVMEHIPPEDVPTVIANIMASTPAAFFQIATVPDNFGAVIGQKLHLTVQPHEWWAEQFAGYSIEWQEAGAVHSCFYIKRA